MELLGFKITRQKDEDNVASMQPIVPESTDDGAVVVNSGGVQGQYVDLDGTIRSEAELINKYREMSENPDMELAIDNITNEAIVREENKEIVDINLEKTQLPDKIKDILIDEFNFIKLLFEFHSQAYELFKRWYVDGRLYFQALVDMKHPELGIQEIRYIDPRKIRKVREVQTTKDPRTQAPLTKTVAQYYVFNEKGFVTPGGSTNSGANYGTSTGVKISIDSIIHTTSGITSAKGDIILSYLHKGIKPLNMLTSLEDSLIVYRVSRAPERRIFYIDIGNLPKMKAEQYVKDMMTKFKNKVVYDSATGTVRDDRKFMTMLEDFWLPRREGGRGTQIEILPGGQNLNQIDDIIFFQRKLFRSLNVPITRLDPEAMFNYGRANEITRDEVIFMKFVDRLRDKFALLFKKTMGKQLVLKNIMTPEEWDSVQHLITFNWAHDSYFEEIKNAEIMTERFNILETAMPFVGRFYSNKFVRKNLLFQTDEQMKQEDAEIYEEMKNPLYQQPVTPEGMPIPPMAVDPENPTGLEEPEPEPKPAPAPKAPKVDVTINLDGKKAKSSPKKAKKAK